MDVAEELLEGSKLNPVNYMTPRCCIRFYNGVSEKIRKELEKLEIIVQNIKELGYVDKENYHFKSPKLVNLDITALIALTSDLTNGNCNHEFLDNPELSNQAKNERKTPILPIIYDFLYGKSVVVTKTAVKCFETILETVGGEEEKKRAELILSKIKIIEDKPSERISNFKESIKCKEKHKNIFGTSDTLKASKNIKIKSSNVNGKYWICNFCKSVRCNIKCIYSLPKSIN
jgi:hypothetical protein